MALGDRWAASPGWLYGRLDFGLASGPNLCQIDRVSGPAELNQSIPRMSHQRVARRTMLFVNVRKIGVNRMNEENFGRSGFRSIEKNEII